LFCDALLRLQRQQQGDLALLNVRRIGSKTVVTPFPSTGPLFDDAEIAQALADPTEDTLFEKLLRRGLVDA
jgi:hypothetical protein